MRRPGPGSEASPHDPNTEDPMPPSTEDQLSARASDERKNLNLDAPQRLLAFSAVGEQRRGHRLSHGTTHRAPCPRVRDQSKSHKSAWARRTRGFHNKNGSAIAHSPSKTGRKTPLWPTLPSDGGCEAVRNSFSPCDRQNRC